MAPGLDISTLDTLEPTLALTLPPTKQPSINITSIASTLEPHTQALPQDTTLVLHPSFITQDFDLLRFEAAAYDQIPKTIATNTITTNKDQSPSPAYSTHLISSPYNNPGHYLDLTTLPLPSLLFAKALSALAPTCPTYATTPYASALNFDTVLSVLRSQIPSHYTFPTTSFYVVVFQSKLKPGIDMDWLYKLDYESHAEACESGGLLKYWFGKADGERRNLATCKLSSYPNNSLVRQVYRTDMLFDDTSIGIEFMFDVLHRFLALED
jgi:hypothetical protein